MTIARDKRTGAVVGQVVDYPRRNALGEIVPSGPSPDPARIVCLTRYGYMTFTRSCVRLEELR